MTLWGVFYVLGISLCLEIIGAHRGRYNGLKWLIPKRYPHRRFVCAVWVFCFNPWFYPLYAAGFVTGALVPSKWGIVKSRWGKCDRQIFHATQIAAGQRNPVPILFVLPWCSRPCLRLYCFVVLSLHHIIALSPCILPSVAFYGHTLYPRIPNTTKSILGPFCGLV